MTIGERIKLFRESSQMTQEELADKLNTTKQTIYKYENSIITNIPSDKLQRMAEIFKVQPTVLMGWDPEFIKIEQEMYKTQSRETLNNPQATLEEKYNAKLGEYFCLYARSVNNAIQGGHLNHPDFSLYVARMLNQPYEKERTSNDVYQLLINNFGKAIGMKNGATYWEPKIDMAFSQANTCNQSEINLLNLYNKLNPEGQGKVVEYLDDLVSSGKYSNHAANILKDYITPITTHERTDIEVTDEMRKRDDEEIDLGASAVIKPYGGPKKDIINRILKEDVEEEFERLNNELTLRGYLRNEDEDKKESKK